MKVLIVVPAYNEAKNLPILIPNIHRYGWESLVINDGSTDNTAEVLEEIGCAHLNLINNVGLAGVTQIGFMYAHEHNYDAVIVTDGDGQHPPKFISSLVKGIEEGNDYVVGSRFITAKKPMTMRMIGSRLICFAIWLKTGVKVSDPTSGMRALGKNLLEDFAENMNFIAEPDALTYVLKKGYNFKEVQVDMLEREEGESYFHNPLKSISFMYQTLMSILFLR
ncbi:MAG: glycosyltransferase family 2 protein [Solobacterium sp.]|nr:glycosyltransferase family 2 protein [Solobacterium sp.]